jgi:hypothetical protein
MWDTDQAYAHITAPLRKMMTKETMLVWRVEQQKSQEH